MNAKRILLLLTYIAGFHLCAWAQDFETTQQKAEQGDAEAQTKTGSNEHLTFKGVPINGTLNEFISKMEKSGFTHVATQTIYKLFPTQNYWTFIKLDTRNGKMWQVHFTVKEDGGRGELILNSIPLVDKEEEVNGRFTLYPTENMYNFLLLDQIDGYVYQVQWSMEEEYRGVIDRISNF